MLLQWKRIKPNIYSIQYISYLLASMSSTTHHLLIHSLSFTSKTLLTVVDLAYPCSLLQLHIKSARLSSQLHLNIL